MSLQPSIPSSINAENHHDAHVSGLESAAAVPLALCTYLDANDKRRLDKRKNLERLGRALDNGNMFFFPDARNPWSLWSQSLPVSAKAQVFRCSCSSRLYLLILGRQMTADGVHRLVLPGTDVHSLLCCAHSYLCCFLSAPAVEIASTLTTS